MDDQLLCLKAKVQLLERKITDLTNDIKNSENELIRFRALKNPSKKDINKIKFNIK